MSYDYDYNLQLCMFFLEITDGGTFTDDDMLVKYFCRIYYDSSFIAILLLDYGSSFVNK
jgi:hypothetical protein